jgi:hypothetical protein
MIKKGGTLSDFINDPTGAKRKAASEERQRLEEEAMNARIAEQERKEQEEKERIRLEKQKIKHDKALFGLEGLIVEITYLEQKKEKSEEEREVEEISGILNSLRKKYKETAGEGEVGFYQNHSDYFFPWPHNHDPQTGHKSPVSKIVDMKGNVLENYEDWKTRTNGIREKLGNIEKGEGEEKKKLAEVYKEYIKNPINRSPFPDFPGERDNLGRATTLDPKIFPSSRLRRDVTEPKGGGKRKTKKNKSKNSKSKSKKSKKSKSKKSKK